MAHMHHFQASQGANVVFLTGDGRAAPVSWKSKNLDQITKSPLASEVMAVADTVDSIPSCINCTGDIPAEESTKH